MRYVDESVRVLGVLEGALQGGNEGWLVGGRCSAADLVFVPYMWSTGVILGEDMPDLAGRFPGVDGWVKRMGERKEVVRVKEERDKALKASIAAAAQGKSGN